MSHDNHTNSDSHRELDYFGLPRLEKMVAGWKDPFPKPIVETVKIFQKSTGSHRQIRVVRDDLSELGTKIRAASAVFHQKEYQAYDTIVYVAPRAGWAPISLAKLCAMTGKRLILFCPACEVISHHQQVAYELGAELRFIRVAAMPNLQRLAKDFADRHGYLFFPLGLAVPSAVAGIMKVAIGLKLAGVHEVWSVISTGVLSRGLQLAWPDARHFAVAVSRNIKEGEKGIANLFSHPKPFLQNVKKADMPPFPSASNYDAAAWTFIVSHARDNAVFWNVAGEIRMTFTKPLPISRRDWGDHTDLGIK